MLIPLIIPRGYSLDEFSWTDWFNRRCEHIQMNVFYRVVPGGNFEVKVEVALLGIPYIRGLFAYGDSDSNRASTTLVSGMHKLVMDWLNAAWNMEVEHKAGQALDMARRMGMMYVAADQSEDAGKFYFDKLDELAKMQMHLNIEQEQQGISPDRYSAFKSVIENMDMDEEIDGE